MSKFILGLFLALAMLSSCRSGRLQKKGVELGKADSLALNTAFKVSRPEFKQIRFKTDADIESPSMSRRIPVTIHLQKDEIIWATVSIGLEIGRLKITPDSIQVIDRFNRRAYVGTWLDVNGASGLDLNFQLLQSLLVGDLPFDLEETDKVEAWNIIQERFGRKFTTKIDPTVFKPFKINGKDTGGELELNYQKFVQEKDQLLPSLISLIWKGKSEMKLEFSHSRIEVMDSGLSFSFSIPSSYKIERFPGL
ncbi:DUF4292 domain-containing protein [Leadbetterella byssophila]|uniref:DUF4292 domain-containing protein n=1 Tax=Leadbetterella byssophila TaxID=316068 RepID=UPI0039A3F27B